MSFYCIASFRLDYIDAKGGTEVSAPPRALDDLFHQSTVFSILRYLPSRTPEGISGRLLSSTAEAGDVIVPQGNPAEKFFIIVDGEVEVVRTDDGAERRVATLGEGEFFGEIAILRDVPRTATVRALRPTALLTMDRDTFRSLVASRSGPPRTWTASSGNASAPWPEISHRPTNVRSAFTGRDFRVAVSAFPTG